MLRFRVANIFRETNDGDILVNPVNCVGAMGRGLAAAFRGRYPDLYREYREACSAGQVVPGRLFIWNGRKNKVLCVPTKNDWRDRSTEKLVLSGLQAMRAFLVKKTKTELTVRMPALGCGLGGLSWIVVKSLIEIHLKDVAHQIVVYAPRMSNQYREGA